MRVHLTYAILIPTPLQALRTTGKSIIIIIPCILLWCEHSNASSLAVLTHGAICFSEFEKMKLWHLVKISFWLNLAVRRLNEVCLHITYLFLKELVILSAMFFLALLSHENLHSLPEVVWRVFFTGIDSSGHTAVSSAQVIYSFFKNLFIYFIVIANIFFYKSIAWSLLSRIPYSVSVIPVPFPDSCFSAARSWSLTAILNFYGGYRWLLVLRLPFPAPRSPLSSPRSPFPVLVTS